jgi:Ca2+:H+ antiporter
MSGAYGTEPFQVVVYTPANARSSVGSIVEIIMFMVLLKNGLFTLLKGAILGSILANVLLCLGACFIASGVRRLDGHFHEAITEAGSGMLLTSAIGLAVPAIFEASTASFAHQEQIDRSSIAISRGVAILLLLSYLVFVWFQGHTHHSVFTEMFEHDEQRDADREKELIKDKLTFTESIVALVISVGLVTVIAIILVLEIPDIIEIHGITDPFMGLILVPLVEKAAEHLTALDEAWDNQMNLALAHCVGSTLQTALLNTPLAVIVSWGLHLDFSLDFEIFDMAMLLLSVITIGNFLR